MDKIIYSFVPRAISLRNGKGGKSLASVDESSWRRQLRILPEIRFVCFAIFNISVYASLLHPQFLGISWVMWPADASLFFLTLPIFLGKKPWERGWIIYILPFYQSSFFSFSFKKLLPFRSFTRIRSFCFFFYVWSLFTYLDPRR